MKKKNNQGFSLVELIIAIAILSIIMVAMASFMGTTTRTYTRTKADVEIQQKGQELYDMISDKVMQATCIRIGCDSGEYVSYPSSDTYNFAGITGTAEDINYISVCYEKAGSGGYIPVVDTYYFDKASGEVYLDRISGSLRVDSVNGSDVLVETDVATKGPSAGEDLLLTAVKDPAIIYADDDKLICKNVTAMRVCAYPSDNAISLEIDLKKKAAENNLQGMITIRNNYVLQPKK